MIFAGLKKTVEKRVGRFWPRRELGMELRGDEIRVNLRIKLTNLHTLATAICVAAGERQSGGLQGRYKRGIYLVPMPVSFHHPLFAIHFPGNTAAFQNCFSCTEAHGSAHSISIAFRHEHYAVIVVFRQPLDKFGAMGFRSTQYIAREFDHGGLHAKTDP